MINYATPNQIKTLEDMLTEHNLHTGEYDRLWAILEAHRVDMKVPGDGSRMLFEVASKTIAWLIRQVDSGRASYWCSHIRAVGAGQLSAPIGHRHVADRNGNCHTCGVEMFDPSLTTTH